MDQNPAMKIIAHIRTDFATKFGVPRQSGLVDALKARIVFEEEYRVAEAVRGLEEFSHIWVIWQFSGAIRPDWSPTVRPPRLGGNTRMGVFATRSPFRPNPIGLSSLKLEKIEHSPQFGPVLWVSGADLVDGTPIYDIKPYLPYADCRPQAVGGFAAAAPEKKLRVRDEASLADRLPPEKWAALRGVLEQDPRPSYQKDPDRVYRFEFGGWQVRFSVEGEELQLRQLTPLDKKQEEQE